MGMKCGNMTTDLGIYRDAVSTANTLIIMEKGNLIEKQQICLDANSAASRSKFLHFKSVLTILALCLCVVMGGEVWAQETLLAEGFESITIYDNTYRATDWYTYKANNGNNWTLESSDGHNAPKCARYKWNNNRAADCYLVSSPFTVSANMTNLSVSLYENTGGGFTENFEVFFVKASDVTTLGAVASATKYYAINSASYNNTTYAQKSGSNADAALKGQSVRVVVRCTSKKNSIISTSMTSPSPK